MKTLQLGSGFAVLLCLLSAGSGSAQAQIAPASTAAPPVSAAPAADVTAAGTSATSAAAPQSGDQNVTKLDAFTVSDVPIGEQVLPTVRPIADVMGDDLSIVDIPRSVSAINAAWMQDRNVKNAMDFGQFSPGVYSAAQYGIPAVPFIRGDLAQMYVDGQIIPFSRNSTPPSFNGVEAIDIVKGPGSAVYGPQGEGAGGYVDFVMKEPYFDTFRGDISTTFGDWTSGHSYSNPEATIDVGGPLSSNLAFRVSYLSRYGDGYYINDHNETQDVYAALTYIPNAALKIEGWVQGYSDRTNEISGANRVTQQFIWNGSYIAGPASPVTTGPNAYFGYDIATPGTPPSPDNYGTYADGSYSNVNPATAHVVKLPAYDALIGPSDTARARLFQGQVKSTLTLTPDSYLIDRAYFANGASDKFETYGYDEYVPKQISIQDRLEYHGEFQNGIFDEHVITGLDFRYQELISYQDFTTEPFSYYDLTQPLSEVFYPGYYREGETFGGGVQVPGAPGFAANAASPDAGGSSGNQWSYIYDSAFFLQDDIRIGPTFSMIPGYRVDHISADTMNPPVIEEGYEAFYTYYPLTTPIYIPKGHSSPLLVNESAYGYGVHPTWEGYNVDSDVNDQSYFLSFDFHLSQTASAYLTYDHADAILGSANFGGVNVNGTDATVSQLDKSLTTKSTLYELGYKESFIHNTLFFSAALFQQIKYGAELTGATYPIKDNGLETELVYQPSKRWTFNGNVTYQNATAFGDSFYQQTGNYLDNFATTTPVDGTYGTGVGGPNFVSYVPPTGRERAPGIPQFQANAFVEYKDPSGWGVGAGPQYVGRQYANDQDTLHIPGEYEVDGYIFYGRKAWDVRVNITNLFNHRLLDPIDVSFAGNDTIYVRPPISASITFRYHF